MAVQMGRRPTWYDYKALRRAVDEYFDNCDKTGDFPDYAGMLLHLQIDKEDVKALTAEDNKNAYENARIFNMAALRRESWLARHMVSDKNMATGCMNALKQGENGNYNDKGAEKGDRVLKIVAEGIKGNMSAFK